MIGRYVLGLEDSAEIRRAVAQATRLIRDGQRIRVHGTDGYVEILPAAMQIDV